MRKYASSYPFSNMKEGEYVGVVEEIGFTQGGMGNQWTVIDGEWLEERLLKGVY